MKKTATMMLVVSLIAIMAVPSALACTTWTPGYWKNHSDWVLPPESSRWVDNGKICFGGIPPSNAGGKQYSNSEALTILNTPPQGDASIILKQKMISAILSIGANPIQDQGGFDDDNNFNGVSMGDLIQQGSDFLYYHSGSLKPGADGRAEALSIASQIDYWLNFYDAN